MSNSTKKNNDKGVHLQDRIKKFKTKIQSTKDFISNHKNMDDVEQELAFMSLDTLLEIINKKNKELK